MQLNRIENFLVGAGIVLLLTGIIGNIAYRRLFSHEETIRILSVTDGVWSGGTTALWRINTDKGYYEISPQLGFFMPGGAEKLASQLKKGQTRKVLVAHTGFHQWVMTQMGLADWDTPLIYDIVDW